MFKYHSITVRGKISPYYQTKVLVLTYVFCPLMLYIIYYVNQINKIINKINNLVYTKIRPKGEKNDKFYCRE